MANVTVFSTKGKKRSVVTTNAETWGQLKEDLLASGIDINGQKAIVGETQTTLESSKAVLPKGLDIRGVVSDNFTLFLTPIKVKSGGAIDVNNMSYKECRAFIRDLYAQSDSNKAYFGNYTRKTTGKMKTLIKGWLEANSATTIDNESENDFDTVEYYINVAVYHLTLLKDKILSGNFNKEEVVDEVEVLEQQWKEIKENL